MIRDLTALAAGTTDGGVDGLRKVLAKAELDLNEAEAWAKRQVSDPRLRLKAAAANHFEDGINPLCPICEQPLKETGAPSDPVFA